jgi:hypothetical protein
MTMTVLDDDDDDGDDDDDDDESLAHGRPDLTGYVGSCRCPRRTPDCSGSGC